MRAAALLALGLLVGSVGAMIQTHTLAVGSAQLPTGAVLAVGATVLIARGGAWWQGSRLGAITFSVGWLTATLMMGSTTGAGDLVITSGNRQMGYLIGGTILLSAACGYALLPPEDAPPRDGSDTPDGPASAGAQAADA